MPLLDVVQDRVRGCTSCWLSTADHVTAPVPYRGPMPAPVVVVGEAPGDEENRAGEPFVGRSGKLLVSLLKKAGIDPGRSVGFCNVVACHPGRGNKGRTFRVPALAEVDACRPNLLLQVTAAQPTVVILLGATALSAFRPDLKISKDRGRPMVIPPLGKVVVPTYHPAAATRGARHLEGSILKDLAQARWRWKVDAMGRWPEDCRLCPNPVDRYDEHGVAWCWKHDPERGGVEKVSGVPLTLMALS